MPIKPRDGEEQHKYYCSWCSHTFTARRRTIAVTQGTMARKQKVGTNQIRCKKCGNFLKTWPEDKE